MPVTRDGSSAPYTYAGDHLREVAFPLGGIGTGCVSLEGRGSLRDWEIFNRPNKGSILPMTFPILWCRPEDGSAPAQTRVVHGPPNRGFIGHAGDPFYASYGFGMTRSQGDGLPRLAEATFRGTFPFASIAFEQPGFPLEVSLRAFSPFIPLEHELSGMPVASLTYCLRNTLGVPMRATLAMSLYNAVGYAGHGPFTPHAEDRAANVFREGPHGRGLEFTNARLPAAHPRAGSMALTTDWPDVTVQPYWLRAGWFDSFQHFWDTFSREGELDADAEKGGPGAPVSGAIGLRATIPPGEAVELSVLISWCFPNFAKYWGDGAGLPEEERPRWTNHYARRWPTAWAAAESFFARRAELTRRTEAFETALFGSTLPPEVVESVSATASILHSPTCLQLEDGTFWAWEGCAADSGCCEGSCTHVWNYAVTQAYLFPALHRTMRAAEYAYGFDAGEEGKKGAVAFRVPLPLGRPANLAATFGQAASDGQLGGLAQLYRDWRLSGDEAYLRRMWPHAKRALAYAWAQWDADRDGLVEGVQHNTFDINFHGPNPLTQFFYLAALRAGEEIAGHLGERGDAREYRRLYELGREKTAATLYNGEYFEQAFDCLVADAPKYQHGKGCLSDQVFGQLAARVAGLGDLVGPAMIRSALAAVFRHNFRDPLGDHVAPQRIYALADEGILLTCSWPRGGRPAYPFPYADEGWTGLEYQVASHLIYEGLAEEGLAIVRAARARHDGRRRNPYNEFECGSHYARAMSAWGLLLALSGFRYDAVTRTVEVTPRGPGGDRMRCFFSTGTAWGTFEATGRGVEIDVIEGEMSVGRVVMRGGETRFDTPRRVAPGKSLTVKIAAD